METYTVMWNYKSSLGGPWQAGDVIELEPAKAEAIGKDSPGVLKKGKAKVAAPKDRQVKKAEQSNFGAITREDFKAVKG